MSFVASPLDLQNRTEHGDLAIDLQPNWRQAG
jgi:hypothetical protein